MFKPVFTAITLLFFFQSFAQNGLDFDGVNDYVQTNYAGVPGNGARTVEAWIKTTASTTGNQKVITDWGTFATGQRFTFCLLSNDAIRVEVSGSGLSGTIPVNDGNWHHVATVYDPTATFPAKLYVDGVLDVEGTLSVTVNTGNSINLRIGSRVDGVNTFEGQIDEVRVWNTAKTLAQLQANMNNELCSRASDLMAYYRCNQGVAGGSNFTESTLYDDSGFGNNGALVSFDLTGASSNWITGATLTNGFSTNDQTEVHCNSYFWPADGNTYTTTGMYAATLSGVNAAGCDSIVTLDLTINTATDLTTNIATCDSFTWSVNGVTYTTSASDSMALINGQGCAYMHYLNLILGNSNASSTTETSCGSYQWLANGMTYTTTGVYTATLNNASGCDSVVTLDLTINNVDNSGQNNGDGTLSANAAGVQYQWLDCNNNFAPITGETNQIFTPTANGSYAVQVTDNGCVDTSACIAITNVGLAKLTSEVFHFYPNPTNGAIQLDLGEIKAKVTVTVLSIEGRVYASFVRKNVVTMPITINGESGQYLLKVEVENGATRYLKLIKE